MKNQTLRYYLVPLLLLLALAFGAFFWGWYLAPPRADADGAGWPLALAVISSLIVLAVIVHLLRRNADQGAAREAIARSLEESEEKYRSYVEAVPEGFFLVTPEGELEADNRLLRILGYSGPELAERELQDIVDMEEASIRIIQTVLEKKGVYPGQIEGWLITKGGEKVPALFTISTIHFEGEGSEAVVIVKDLRLEKKVPSLKLHRDKDKLIAELQSALLFLRQPVRKLAEPFLACHAGRTIREAGILMTENRKNALIVTGAGGEPLGIVTDQDIRERVVASGCGLEAPVESVMSAPLIAIPETALFYEAVYLMQDRRIGQVGLEDHDGKIRTLLTDKALLARSARTSGPFLEEIKWAESVEELQRSYQRLPAIIESLVKVGAHARNITGVVSRAGDIILKKIIDMGIAECGEPPAAFCFLTLGSEGREEETLLTDQDNAIVYADVTEGQEEVHRYFLALGEYVCNALDRVGYSFCKGGIMAKNPRWCQPESQWKAYFSQWLKLPDGEHLLDINIFFDLRCSYGQRELSERLKDHIQAELQQPGSFYYFMAQAVSDYKPPLGVFGQIKAEYTEEDDQVFNIKRALAPLIIYARMMALKNGLRVSNTLKRLERLYEIGALKESSFRRLENGYNYLVTLRFRDQIETLEANEPLDNLIYMEELMDFEMLMLKKIFTSIAGLQNSLKVEYGGTLR